MSGVCVEQTEAPTPKLTQLRNSSTPRLDRDGIITFINAHPERYGNASIRYSTFSEYFARLKALRLDFPVLSTVPGESTMDSPSKSPPASPFMPHYMNGYYGSYPALKAAYGKGIQALRHAETWAAIASAKGFDEHQLGISDELDLHIGAAAAEIALMSHHDAIPATGYNFYTTDSTTRVQRGTRALLTRVLPRVLGSFSANGDPELIPHEEDNHDSWVCPSMGATDELLVVNSLVAASRLGDGTTRAIQFFACTSDLIVSLASTGKILESQADRVLDMDGKYLITTHVDLHGLNMTTLLFRQGVRTTNTDVFPPINTLAVANVSRERSSRDASEISISNSKFSVELSTTSGVAGVTLAAAGGKGAQEALDVQVIVYPGAGSSTYSFKPEPGNASLGAALAITSYDLFVQEGHLTSKARLVPHFSGFQDEERAAALGLSIADITFEALWVEVAKDDPFIRLSFDFGTVGRGSTEVGGYNIVGRLSHGCRKDVSWTYAESANRECHRPSSARKRAWHSLRPRSCALAAANPSRGRSWQQSILVPSPPCRAEKVRQITGGRTFGLPRVALPLQGARFAFLGGLGWS